MSLWIVAGLVVWLGLCVLVVALSVMAARGDAALECEAAAQHGHAVRRRRGTGMQLVRRRRHCGPAPPSARSGDVAGRHASRPPTEPGDDSTPRA